MNMFPKATQKLIDEFLANPDGRLPKLTAKQLGVILFAAADAYHNTSKPFLSDDLYDVMKARLAKLDPAHPYLHRVGAPVPAEAASPVAAPVPALAAAPAPAANKHKAAVELPYFMGSLDKIKDDPRAIARFVKKYEGPFMISDKLDGISALLQWSKGAWAFYTRGDGTKGQNISHLLPAIQGIPPPPTTSTKMVFRGELILSKAAWKRLESKGSNARNVVAGTVNAKHPDPEILRELEYRVYSVYEPRLTPQDGLALAASLGFRVVHHDIVDGAVINVEDLTKYLINRREHSPFEVDGIVVIHNALHNIIAGKNPQHSFAFKSILTHEEAEVIISEVEWNASKDGYLKPLVHFEPVYLGSVWIRKANGFNAQFIEANAVGPGARIIIIRSGDVIPHILRVISPSFTGKGSMPQDVEYEWNDTHIDIILKNKDDAKDVKLKRLQHFVKHLDIKYVAEGTLIKLFEAGFNTMAKILALKQSDLLRIDGFAAAGAAKIVQSIAEARAKATCEDYMAASTIFGRGLGLKTLKALVAAFPEVREYKVPSKAALSQTIPNVGKATIEKFVDGLPEFFKFAKEIGLSCAPATAVNVVAAAMAPATPTASEQLGRAPGFSRAKIEGKSFVFTGFRNKEWEKIIESLGGIVSGSVSKKTSYVIAKDDSGTNAKVQKAKDLGISIIREDAFEKYFSA